jgi:triacylglycerol lipase
MTALKPVVAAELARDVYAVQQELELQIFMMRPEFSNSSGQKISVKARVGTRLINTRDGFAVCAVGGKDYSNDIFLVFRGSTMANLYADWVSNARIGVTSTLTGPVHSGFNNIFSSILPEIQKFVKDHEKPGAIFHCIGHSLGGAVAMLCANWLKSNKGRSVKLYSFGAPKSGMYLYSSKFTQKIGKENIFRAYHPTDPVPMIPLFPYLHAPLPGYGHYIPVNENMISTAAHDIRLYVKSVTGTTWNQLERRKPPYTIESGVEQWLRSVSPVSASSPKIWEWINAGLIYVLKKITGNALTIIQGGFIGALTVADTIAYILRKGIDMSVSVGEWVIHLMRKIMQVLGMRVIDDKKDLTQEVMRTALIKVMDKTTAEAKKAVMDI